MKVVHIFISLPVGGAEDLALSLCKHSSTEQQVQIVCLRELGSAGEEAFRQNLSVQLLPTVRRRQFNPFAVQRLAKWLRQQRADVVHSHVYNAHVYAVLAAKLVGLPAVMHHHKTVQSGRRRRWLMLRWLSRMAAAQIVLSNETRDGLVSFLRLSLEKFYVLPNAVDSDSFHPISDRPALRRELGFAPEAKLIGSIASLTPQKNHSSTLRMMDGLTRQGLNVQCIICGEGPLRNDLQAELEQFSLAGRVQLLGNKRPIAPWLQCLDLLVLPSTWEGQPMILLQAMACDVPVIASDIEGNTTALGAGHPGLFDLKRESSYLEQVRSFFQNRDLCDQILAHQQRHWATQQRLSDYRKRLNEIYDAVRLKT